MSTTTIELEQSTTTIELEMSTTTFDRWSAEMLIIGNLYLGWTCLVGALARKISVLISDSLNTNYSTVMSPLKIWASAVKSSSFARESKCPASCDTLDNRQQTISRSAFNLLLSASSTAVVHFVLQCCVLRPHQALCRAPHLVRHRSEHVVPCLLTLQQPWLRLFKLRYVMFIHEDRCFAVFHGIEAGDEL